MIGGPASSGVRKAFSQEPCFGSGVGTGRVGAVVMVGGVWVFSILSSATCASNTRFRFIRFSSIWRALSSLIPGLSPFWNLKAKVTASAAIMTITAMSIVLNES